MFEFIKDTNLALDQLAKKDKKYKSILSELKTLLSRIKGEFLTFEKAHKQVELETNDAHLQVKNHFNEQIKQHQLNFDRLSDDIDQKIAAMDTKYAADVTQISDDTTKQIHTIKTSIESIEKKFNDARSNALVLRSKNISDVSKVIIDIRKQSALSIEKLENAHQVELDKFLASYDIEKQAIEQTILDATKKHEVDIAKIHELKNYYREQSDKKYLSIKNDYHLASSDFNKAIDKLKKEKSNTLQKIQKADDKNRVPIEEALTQLQVNYNVIKDDVTKIYKNKLSDHKLLIQEITLDFNKKKEKLIVENGEAVSLINSKLSSFRDVVAQERLDQTNQLKIDVANAPNEDEAKSLKKAFQRLLRQQENELNRQIIRTEKETQSLLKLHYQKLQSIENDYLEQKSNWRIHGKKLVLNQKLENYNNEQNYLYQLKSLQLQLKTLQTTNEFEVERAEINHLSQIAPLDLNLSIANAISEKDVNLLSNDTNFHLNHYQHQEDTLSYEFSVLKLQKEHEFEVLNLNKEHTLSVLNMKLQLSIDKENVIREQQLNNQQLKKDFYNATYNKNVAIEELSYLRQKALFENDIIHLQKHERSYHHYLSDINIIDQSLLKHQRNIKDAVIHYEERSDSVDMTNDMMKKDLEVIHSRIHYLFNQIYLIYNIHHHFMLSLIEIYNIPAHPEDVKQYIHLYLDVFNHLNHIQEHAKDQFLFDLNAFQEIKINDLSALKLKTDMNLLESDYIHKIKHIDQDIESKQNMIQQVEDRILVLSSNVDRVQFELNTADEDLDASHVQSTRKYLNKQLNAIETEISILDKSIAKQERLIQSLTKRKNRLTHTLTKKQDKTTTKNQNEAKSYLKQKSFYLDKIKQISHLFKTYEDKVLLLTKKIDQPLYLTDNIIKEYQKGFDRIEDYYEKSTNQLYQSLLKGSVKLFDQLIAQQNNSKNDFLVEQKLLFKKLDKQQHALEDKLKTIHHDFKHHLTLLDNEKGIIIKDIETSQFKDHELEITNLQKELQFTENQVMTTESNLKKEMLLIDDNLQSVILQMNDDFNKQLQKNNINLQKILKKHQEQIDEKTKSLKSLEESTQAKNSQLSLRFTQTESKLIEANKQKLDHHESTIAKKHAALIKHVEAYAGELKEAQQKRDMLVSKNERKLVKFSLKVEAHEKKLLLKDLKDAKASYTFKQKTLKL